PPTTSRRRWGPSRRSRPRSPSCSRRRRARRGRAAPPRSIPPPGRRSVRSATSSSGGGRRRRGAALALAALVAGACGGEPRPSLLLVTLDTLRTDHVGAYGASPSPTPRLDALA